MKGPSESSELKLKSLHDIGGLSQFHHPIHELENERRYDARDPWMNRFYGCNAYPWMSALICGPCYPSHPEVCRQMECFIHG